MSGRGSVGAVKTVGSQSYSGNHTFNGKLESTSFGSISFSSGSGTFASGGGAVMAGSSGNIQVSNGYTINAPGGQQLDFKGNTFFSAGSGTIDVNARLFVDGLVSLNSGKVNFNDTLFSSGVLQTSGNGTYTFNSVVGVGSNVLINNFGGSVTFNGTLFGNQLTSLPSAPVSIRGGAVFVGDICIGNLNTVGGTIATNGDLVVGGNINLASDTVVVVKGTIDADPSKITLNGNTLTLVGSIEFDPVQLNLAGIVVKADQPNRTVVFSPFGEAPVINQPQPSTPAPQAQQVDFQMISSLIDQAQIRNDGAGSALSSLISAAFGGGDMADGTATSDTDSSEASSFASVFDSGEGGDSGGGQQGSQGGAGGPPQGQSKAKQVEAPAVSSVTPVLGGIVGRVVNSSYQGAAGVPGLGANSSSGTGSAMP
jgi:hypothetical protein